MNWVVVHRSNAVTEAEMLENMLESFGVPARLSYESVGKLGMIPDKMGISILVPEDRAKEAQDLLAENITPEA